MKNHLDCSQDFKFNMTPHSWYFDNTLPICVIYMYIMTSCRSVWNLGNDLAEEAKPDGTQVPTHLLIYWTQVRPPILSSIHSKPSLSPARRLQTHVSSPDRKSSAWGPAKAQVCSQGGHREKSQWPTLPNGLSPKACSLQKYNQWPNSTVLGQPWL